VIDAGAPGVPPTPLRLGAAELPQTFRELLHPPAGLWSLGDTGLLEGAPDRHVAIVGTRDASAYAERTADLLARACAEAGLVVVSGLARGVDAAAHRAALAASGRTIAVMGTGVDVPYPVGHRTLHREVAARGLVLSEYEVGSRAGPGSFPRRNRLIAGLCRVTVVVEAGHKSGALNTASQALELGREVAVVPGPLAYERCAGSNALLRDGAKPITAVEDLLEMFDLSPRDPSRRRAIGAFAVFDHESVGTDELSVRQHSERLLLAELAAGGGSP
jgi:DNA processing protein